MKADIIIVWFILAGLLISAFCEEENTAIQCALGSVYPNMLLSGEYNEYI